MKSNNTKYWLFQIGGWLFYTFASIFFIYLYVKDDALKILLLKRVALEIGVGFFFTHILRLLIIRLKLLPPPLSNSQWITLIFLFVFTAVISSFSNSVLIEVLKWYDGKTKGTIFQRFGIGLMNTTPIVLIWTSIYYLWHYVEANRNTQLDKIRLEALVKELELKTIKSRINPHFIFNALNSIRALVDENPERARTAITELSSLLRSSMSADNAETTTLEKELNIVKDYLALEQIRFEDRLKIEYEIDEDTLDQPVPPMMLQTLVENAIKHGISKQTNGGLIKIISDFVDDHHELSVLNTGEMAEVFNPEGFGVSSTKNRLFLLFGNKASFNLIDRDDNIIEAKVILPFKQ